MAVRKKTRAITRTMTGRWQVRVRHNGRNTSAVFDSYEVAVRFRDEMQADALLRKHGLPGLRQPSQTVLEVLQAFLDRAAARVAGSTAITYRDAIKPLEAFLRSIGRVDLRAAEMDDALVARFIQWRRTHRLSKDARRLARDPMIFKSLKILAQALREARAPQPWTMPTQARLKRDLGGKRIPTEAQVSAFLEAMPFGSLERTVCEVAVGTGLRAGDVHDLRWSEIDLGTAVLRRVANKTAREVVVPLSGRVLAHLRAWMQSPERVAAHDGRVFLLEGRPLTSQSLRRRFAQASTAAGIEPGFEYVGFLRNVFVAYGLESGDLAMTQRAVGHSDPSVTTGYARRHVPMRGLRAIVAAVEERIGVAQASSSGITDRSR